jgi:hypothetical protein
MMNSQTELSIRRAAVALGLAGIAAVHVLDLPGKWTETRYLGFAYLGVIFASLVLMEKVITRGSRNDLFLSAGLAASVIGGFVINRTVGMPGAMDDIGNWLEPLGLLSLLCEGLVVWQSIAALRAYFVPSAVAADATATREFAGVH